MMMKHRLTICAMILSVFTPQMPAGTADPNCGQWGYAPVDFNKDCQVDILDFSEFAGHWMSCTFPWEQGCVNLATGGAAGSLQDVIDNALAGDEIIIKPGSYTENIVIDKDIYLHSAEGAEVTIIDGSTGGTCLTFTSNVTSACVVEGLTFNGGTFGGINGQGATPTIRSCIISGNSGGNIILQCNGDILNCKIRENTSTNTTGIIVLCDGRISGNVIENNSTGSGNSIFALCNGIIENNVITSNTAGAAVFVICEGNIRNNTIYGNLLVDATWFGCSAQITNNIDWNNFPNGVKALSGYTSSTPTHCLIENDVTGGAGNIDAPPQFLDADNGDFYLRSDSPCIDSGYAANAPTTDFDGIARDSLPDIGAFEFTGDLQGDVINVSTRTPYPTIQDAIYSANTGDIIEVKDGLYEESLIFSRDITLRSVNGAMATTVATSNDWVLTFNGTETPNCLIEGFTFTGNAGCINGNATLATIIDCIVTGVSGNHTILDFDGNIAKCRITSNTSAAATGVFVLCDGMISRNLITNNFAPAGNSIFATCHGTIENNLIIDNQSGAAVFVICQGLIRNNTIYRSIVNNGIWYGCSAKITNNIAWYFSGDAFVELNGYFSSSPTYCNIEGYSQAGLDGNIDSDPMFADAPGGVFTLLPGSPCIDSGNTVDAPQNDFAGENRPLGAAADIGAYESMYYPQDIVLRDFPYPYKAGLTISSDIDGCSRDEFLEIHQFLNTKQNTSENVFNVRNTDMGIGVGLEIGDSFWMYDATPNPEEFSYFEGTSSILSGNADLIRTYAHAGYLDVMHSFGDFSQVGGFTRQMAGDAIYEMNQAQIAPQVYVNHGDSYNHDDIGYPWYNFWHGDLVGSLEYHTDLSVYPNGPFKFLWKSENTAATGYDPLHTVTLADGNMMHAFWKYYGPGWQVYHLNEQLSPSNLDALVASRKYMMLVNHFGAHAPVPVFDAENRAALRDLARRYENGDIYVATSVKLLVYNYVHDNLTWTEAGNCAAGYIINITNVRDIAFGDFIPTLEELQGITFYADCPANTFVMLDGIDVTDQLVLNPADETGRPSVSFPLVHLGPWPEWTSNGLTRKTENYSLPDYNYTFSITNIDNTGFAPTLTYIGLHAFDIRQATAGTMYYIDIPDGRTVHLPLLQPGQALEELQVINGQYNTAIPRLTDNSNSDIDIVSATFDSEKNQTAITLAGEGTTELTVLNLPQLFVGVIATVHPDRSQNITAGVAGRTELQSIHMTVLPSLNPVTIAVETWETSGQLHRKWTESSDGEVVVSHTIGDLLPNNSYSLKIDGNVKGVYVADSSGRISFTTNGQYLNTIFEIQP